MARKVTRDYKRSQTRLSDAPYQALEPRKMLAPLAPVHLTFNGGTNGDPEVQTGNANARRSLIDQPYFSSSNELRRVGFWLLAEQDGFPIGGRDVDGDNRVPKLDLPRILENRVRGRTLQPFVNNTSDRIKGFRAEFDHSVSGEASVLIISAQEDYEIRPYKLVESGSGLEIQYFADHEFGIERIGDDFSSGNTRREHRRIVLHTLADGIDFDLVEGPFIQEGGPEHWEDFKFATEAPEIEFDTNIDSSGNGTVSFRLTTRPSIRASKDLANGSGDPAIIARSQYQQVGVQLGSDNGLLRFNGGLSTNFTFDALNWQDWQHVTVTNIGDGNTIYGVGGSDIVRASINSSVSRYDSFFNRASEQNVGVTIPDDDNSRPQLLPQSFSITENSTFVGAVQATDPNASGGDRLDFTLFGSGFDNSKFQISNSGTLSFLSAPDYEMPTDTSGTPGDNVYQVWVQVQDLDGETDNALMTVVVLPENDNSPVFTSTDNIAIDENSTDVVTLAASDNDLPAQSLSFSISGGEDASKFRIVNGNQLEFIQAPDFELPSDRDGDNVYLVQVSADDGELTTPQDVTVTVRDIDDTPPLVERVVLDDGREQRSVIRTIQVQFDSHVNISAGAFTISKDAGKAIGVTFTTELIDGKTVAYLDLPSLLVDKSGSLVDGAYQLTINTDSVLDLAGNALDGDRDGVPGGNYIDDFFRKFGDSDGDGDVDLDDYQAFQKTFLEDPSSSLFDAAFDADDDGDVDIFDFIRFRRNFGS